MQVVITGATGFIGSELLRALLLRPEIEKIFLLIRPNQNESAEQKFERIIKAYWQKFKPVTKDQLSRVQILSHDLKIRRPCEPIVHAKYFFHCAANTDLSLPLALARAGNLFTTQNALRLAKHLPDLKCFVHMSTAFVAGRNKGEVREDAIAQKFHNFYEQSKKEAEDAVKSSCLPHLILRPSIVVGDSKDGYVLGFKIIYAMLRLWLSGRVSRAPIDIKAKVDMVPIDFVVQAILSLSLDRKVVNETLHLCAGSRAPTTAQVFNHFLKVFDLPKPGIVRPGLLFFLRLPFVYPFISHGLRTLLQYARWHFPYFGHRQRVFAMTKTRALLEGHDIICPPLENYGENLFQFCHKSKWGKIPLQGVP